MHSNNQHCSTHILNSMRSLLSENLIDSMLTFLPMRLHRTKRLLSTMLNVLSNSYLLRRRCHPVFILRLRVLPLRHLLRRQIRMNLPTGRLILSVGALLVQHEIAVRRGAPETGDATRLATLAFWERNEKYSIFYWPTILTCSDLIQIDSFPAIIYLNLLARGLFSLFVL